MGGYRRNRLRSSVKQAEAVFMCSGKPERGKVMWNTSRLLINIQLGSSTHTIDILWSRQASRNGRHGVEGPLSYHICSLSGVGKI